MHTSAQPRLDPSRLTTNASPATSFLVPYSPPLPPFARPHPPMLPESFRVRACARAGVSACLTAQASVRVPDSVMRLIGADGEMQSKKGPVFAAAIIAGTEPRTPDPGPRAPIPEPRTPESLKGPSLASAIIAWSPPLSLSTVHNSLPQVPKVHGSSHTPYPNPLILPHTLPHASTTGPPYPLFAHSQAPWRRRTPTPSSLSATRS